MHAKSLRATPDARWRASRSNNISGIIHAYVSIVGRAARHSNDASVQLMLCVPNSSMTSCNAAHEDRALLVETDWHEKPRVYAVIKS